MKRKLLEDHLDLVRSIVLKFDRNIMDSDLFGIGCVALVEADRTYIPERGAFSTWATKLIKQSIFDNFKKTKKHNKNQSLENSDPIDYSKSPIPLQVLSVLLSDQKEESKTDKENKKI